MSKFYTDAAEKAAAQIMAAFDNPDDLPEALKNIVLATGGRHSDRYSTRNQLLVAINGFGDAAGFKQWRNSYGRQVRKGEKAFCILAPVTRSFVNDDDERITYITGWRDVKVFGVEQTDVVDEAKWAKHMAAQAEAAKVADSIPWTAAAHAWGLTVGADGNLYERGAAGMYIPGVGIRVAVENLATWAHEIIHASDDDLGTLGDYTDAAQVASAEIVAELGGAILCLIAGHSHAADLGGAWTYIKRYSKDPVKDAGKLLDRIVACVAHVLDTANDTGDDALAPPLVLIEQAIRNARS
jgi:antirestriction protein ArdC